MVLSKYTEKYIIYDLLFTYLHTLVAQTVRNPPTLQEAWVRKILWRRERLSTPVFLPGEFHGQRRLVSYSLWDCKKSDLAEQLTLFIH